ncbi:hypothetical protein HHK36_010942 [Tetracentron sinense]|uniref:RRM domain-containing protein n=1 Tax=Tetracentron sinense TaxID=13715 RepID=A0A834ZB78_TETSI|nr:hypothetical protein HHK36_010942 [Tetracentron sinense]
MRISHSVGAKVRENAVFEGWKSLQDCPFFKMADCPRLLQQVICRSYSRNSHNAHNEAWFLLQRTWMVMDNLSGTSNEDVNRNVGLLSSSFFPSLVGSYEDMVKLCIEVGSWVAGLSYDTNETVLKDTFGQHGEIIEVKVICDRVSGKSKGFGFVQFTSGSAASAALQELDGQLLDGRNIRVHYAHKG